MGKLKNVTDSSEKQTGFQSSLWSSRRRFYTTLLAALFITIVCTFVAAWLAVPTNSEGVLQTSLQTDLVADYSVNEIRLAPLDQDVVIQLAATDEAEQAEAASERPLATPAAIFTLPPLSTVSAVTGPTSTMTPTATTAVTPTPTATVTPSPRPVQPTATATSTSTPALPTPTAPPPPTASPRPRPTRTPAPTATPLPPTVPPPPTAPPPTAPPPTSPPPTPIPPTPTAPGLPGG